MPGDWLMSLDADTRAKAERLIQIMTELDAPDPEGWVKSEIEENIAQFARYVVLRRLWTDVIDSWRDRTVWIERMIEDAEKYPTGYFADAGIALKRALDAGVGVDDIGAVARFVAYESVSGVLQTVDEGYDPDLEDDSPSWALVELDTNGDPTGRDLGGLHGEILSLDPSGREGRPE
jgi:hypothetical protein